MNAINTNLLNAELIHTVKLVLEGILGAGLLTFLWFMAGAYNGGPRR